MGSAARGCLERAAGFGHARRRQRRDPPAERLPRDRVDVVEVDHAVGGDPVRWRQLELGCEATPCSSEGGNHYRSDAICHRVQGQDQDGTVPAWRRREPDLTALYRSYTPTSPPPDPNPEQTSVATGRRVSVRGDLGDGGRLKN